MAGDVLLRLQQHESLVAIDLGAQGKMRVAERAEVRRRSAQGATFDLHDRLGE
jgi:hypothetical protein